MHRIDEAGHVGNLFDMGDPGVTEATVLGAAWPNAVQEEVIYVIEQAGIVLVKGTNTQLRAAIQTMIADSQNLPMGQTVLSGSVDANGYANFLSAGAGLSVDLEANPVPLFIALSSGWHAEGVKGFLVEINADVGSAWSALTASTTLYLYVDRNPGTGAITYGFAATPPSYGYAHPGAPAVGDHSFLIPQMKMFERVAGPAWQEKQRVFVGEVDTGAAAVNAVRTYALRGEFESTEVTPAVTTAYTVNHNLGVKPREMQTVWRCAVANNGYSIGDELVVHAQYGGTARSPFAYWLDALSLGYTTSSQLLLRAKTGIVLNIAITPSDWRNVSYIKRGW